MIILPIARSSAALDYYNSLDLSALRMENIEVTAIDFGLKEMLFDEYLLRDAQLILVGAGFVLVSMWFYTGSLFVTCMTLVAITFSLGISYFFYTLIFRIKFFPFMNLLATVVAVGVGGDASLMMCKVWSCAKSSRQGEGGTAAGAHRHSTLCALVSALTTAAAFYSSYVTSITAICCFSIFAGTAVVANFFVMIGWVPACLVISERWLPSLPWPPPGSDAVVRCTRTAVIWAVLRLRYLWIAALGTLALVAAIAVLYRPRLRLPDTPDLQLFSADHPFERYHLEYKQRFWFERLKRLGSGDAESRLPLRFVWGVVAEDNGDHMDPASMGHLQLDPTFDLSAPESQLWLLSFCSKLRAQPFYQSTVGPLLPNCFLEAFVGWMRQRCSDPIHPGWTRAPCCEKNKFPYGRRVFSKCLPRAASSLYGTPAELSMPGMAGPKFSVEPAQNGIHKLKALVVEYDSNYSHTTSYVEMDRFYRQVETWTRAQMSTAPPGMRNGWFVSDLGLYDVQGCLQTDTIAAAAVSVAVAFLVVLATTLDPVLGLVAVTTIAATIFVTVATLIAIGWRLNVLEAVAVSVAIGLAVDFSVHYVVNYKMAPDKDKRESAVEYALSMMAGPTLMAALTTGVTGALMLPSQVLAYTQIGVFLVVVMTVSWVYATLFMGSVLAVVGPQGGSGGSSLVNWRRRRGCRGGRRRDRSPSAASATTIIHDDELVVLQPQELVALTITPSADRPS
ncbi:hypothetical protein AAG570_011066 [Ranatra chinensis]|uniref:SSD domain-containing protein n=1 Tax=Ranatra chinensis TaxID=642074 RepID=A0ABD0YLP3_9HEMI